MNTVFGLVSGGGGTVAGVFSCQGEGQLQVFFVSGGGGQAHG